MTTLIPYVIFDVMSDDTIIEYGSAHEDELYNCLINEIKRYMEIHDFIDESKDERAVNLTCDDCQCCVISEKYITVIDGKKFCGSCNPGSNDTIIVNKETHSRFTKFLKRNDEKCDIIYFKDGKWIDFEVL
uniref:Uncharacterized protein n=1 Tax=viral metagenome TaxID=1070528 RepID=A0A6C0I8C9_9ZZZZ